MRAKTQLQQWCQRMAMHLSPWLVAAALLAIADYLAPISWDLSVLHLVLCLLAFQLLSRREIPRLIIALLIVTIVPYVIRLPYVIEPVRLWVILALLSAAYSHTQSQRRRKRRLLVRQQLQRRVRRRAIQIRRINDALRREISRRQATQQRLTRTETHLQSLAQRMQLQVIRKDIHGVITYANEAFCRGLGRTVDEVIGSTDADLYDPALADAYRLDDERVMKTGQPVDHIESHPTASGKTGWVQVFKAPEYNDQNEIIGIQMVFWDVTDSYRRTAELRRSEARKRALFEAAREAVLLVDDQGMVVEANPAAEQLLAFGPESLAGQNLDRIAVPESSLQTLGEESTVLLPNHGDLLMPRRRAVESAQRPPLDWTDLPYGQRREIVLRPAGRPTFPAEVSIHPIPLENSFGLAIFIRDVTLRHRALEALQDAKGAAEEASRIKSEFMASVSHEIRTPLGGITGSAELLCQMDLPPKALQYVEMIRHSGELLSNVIGDILDFASIEAGRLQITPEPTDVHRCVGEAFRSLATRALGKDLELVLAIMPDVPRTVLVDANRLRQIIINLAGNAIKFTPAGYVLLRVGVETGEIAGLNQRASEATAEREQQYLRLEMIDSGIGIAKDRLEKIFEPFEQGDSGTTRRFGGTGLGLSISDKLVRRMGGTIQVISRMGHGSTFRCFIPLRSLDSPEATDQSDPPNPAAAAPAVLLKIRHPVQRKAIGDLLLANGFRLDSKADIRIVDQAYAKPRVPGKRPRRGTRTIWIARVDEAALPDQDPHQPVLLKPILPDDLLRLLRSDGIDTTARSDGQELPTNAKRTLGAGTPGRIGLLDASDRVALAANSANHAALLLVDDSPVNQAVIRDFLMGAGYDVDLAGSGRQAIIATQARRYGCVLMDLQMPEMDGIEAMRHIVADHQGRQQSPPPFIALTAHATQEHRERCLAEGMKSFLVKPIDRNKLVETVALWVERSPEAPETVQAESSSAVISAEPMFHAATPAAADVTNLVNTDAPHAIVDGSVPDRSAADPPAPQPWQEKILSTAGGDPATVDALIEAFLTEVPQLCQSLREALGQRDVQVARRAAHTLKSCLKYIAPEADWTRVWEVENAAQQGDLDTAEQLAPAAIETANRWVRVLEAADRMA
jgi:two-component system, sensor histidine kinase and response regulator